jgi:predicted transcriptional regulator
MKDIRISIRLSEEEHTRLKIIAAKKKQSMQNIILDYIRKEIKKEDKKNG